MTPRDLAAVLVLGFVVMGIGNLIAQGTSLVLYEDLMTRFQLGVRPPDSWSRPLVPPLAQVLLGALLFMGSKRIAPVRTGRRTS